MVVFASIDVGFIVTLIVLASRNAGFVVRTVVFAYRDTACIKKLKYLCPIHIMCDLCQGTQLSLFCLVVILTSTRISRAWRGKRFLSWDIILVSSGPCIGLTPSSWRHPGSLGNKFRTVAVVGSLIILRVRMIIIILSSEPVLSVPAA